MAGYLQMTAEEIKTVVAEVLAEQKLVRQNNIDEAMMKTVTAILASFGIEDDDRLELKADFNHLRRWRKSVEQASSYTFKVVVTTLTAGALGALWLGFQSMLHK